MEEKVRASGDRVKPGTGGEGTGGDRGPTRNLSRLPFNIATWMEKKKKTFSLNNVLKSNSDTKAHLSWD
jgi:hypothetical protein